MVPVFTDVKAFLAAMGLPESQKQVYLVVVKRDGLVVASGQGGYDATTAQLLRATLDATD
jgi:hypothetical protein